MYCNNCILICIVLFFAGSYAQPACTSYPAISETVLWNLNTSIAQSFQATSNATSLFIHFYRDNNTTLSFNASLKTCTDSTNCTSQISSATVSSSSTSLDISFSPVNIVNGQFYSVELSANTVAVDLRIQNSNVNGSLFVNGFRNDTADLAYDLCLDPGCEPCYSDTDCSNQGVCVPSPSVPYGYCSCFSGFGGCDCSARPDAQCYFQPVSAMSNNLEANVSMDYQYPHLVIGVSANLEQSKFLYPAFNNTISSPPYSQEFLMYFGANSTSFPDCSFPIGASYETDWKDFAATSSDCTDKYLMNMTWNTAKTLCGFSSADGSRTFTQTLTVQRYYLMESGGTRRVEQNSRFLNVIFPSSVQVGTASTVFVSFPDATVTSFIVLNDYDPYTELWQVVVQTSVASPYVLQAPYSSVASGEVSDRLVNISLASVSGCFSNSTVPCVQKFTYLFARGSAADSCLGLQGSVVSLANVSCTTTACPATSPVNLTMRLHTGDACPVTDQIDWSQTSLNTYKDASVTVQQSNFSIDDIAYFGAVVETTEALITSRSVEPNSVCFQDQHGVCTPVVYTVLPSMNGKDPVFSVNFRDPANFGLFSNTSQPTAFTVQATVQVSFATKSIRKNTPSSQKATVSVTTVVDPNSKDNQNEKDQKASKQVPVMMIAAGVIAAVIVLGGLAAVVLFYKKRTARRRDSMRHINSIYSQSARTSVSIQDEYS